MIRLVATTGLALALAGCTVESRPAPPERFETLAISYSGFNTIEAMSQREVATGCLYNFTRARGLVPVLLPNGQHAGCSRAKPMISDKSREAK